MGFPMSQNLLRGGFGLTVWNRSLEKAAPLADHGADVADSPAQAVKGANFIITMLSDGSVTGALVDAPDVQAALSPDAIWLDMSSIKPEEARAQAAQLATMGIAHLDAPVSGGTKGAEAANLAIMVGGEKSVFDKAAPVFETMGRPVHVGPSGTGQLSKLANQVIVAVTIGAVAEAMLMLEEGGADPTSVRQALSGGFADSVILQQHGTRMSERNFVPGGLSKFQLKDLNNALSEAEALELSLPVTQHIRDRFDHFVHQMEGADQDHSGIFLELLKRNGKLT
ncbi:UNVERIFIED_CONTAM: hypothetical protein GTU68_018899 [Idotea baltica]|nr:hypothetical protein [Idotea baltica]